jgi:DNA mismatch repair ATPase MutS
MNKRDIKENYHSQILILSEEVKSLKRKINKLSLMRLFVFLLAILSIYLCFDFGFTAIILIAVVLAFAFLFLVKIQLKQEELAAFKIIELKLLQNEYDIFEEKDNCYDNGEKYNDPQHAYADDLDIFGKKSIYAYLNRCVTLTGKNLLAAWLLKSSDKNTIENRQEAAQELKQHQKEILHYRVRLFPLDQDQLIHLSSFLSLELKEMLGFLHGAFLKNYVKIIPFLSLAFLIIASINGGVWWSVFGLLLLINGIVYVFHKSAIDVLHNKIDKTVDVLEGYAGNLEWIERTSWQSKHLQSIVAEIKNEYPVYKQINELTKIIRDLNYRLNMVIGTFLNLMFLWDLRCLNHLDRWNTKYNTHILKSFNAIAEFEALISLSMLDYNHPEWVYPVIKDDYFFEAKDLGHPLISETTRVNNDFSLSNAITIDVITGSNMAGKSTFLRTVGVNMILAFAGAKVCSTSFTSSIFHVLSYMRIKDSLTDQTSTFKAEINRLKMILDLTLKDKQAFVLIDEMLRGTNSRDKYLGSKVFIEKLIAQKTPGFIATHDLQIAELEKGYPGQLRNYHFDIQVEGNEMFFDYLMKDGECKTFNAAMLLKAIGLNVD